MTYSDCANIPWYKFQQRKLCEQQADLEAYQLQNNEIQESFMLESSGKKSMMTWLFVILFVIILLVVVAKAKRWI